MKVMKSKYWSDVEKMKETKIKRDIVGRDKYKMGSIVVVLSLRFKASRI